MAIFFQSEDVDFPPIQKQKTKKWIKSIAKSYDRNVGEISYLFCSDKKILEVNQHYLQHDYYTDIITFDYVKGKTISADIFVSLPRISENARNLSKDFDSELHRVLAHGILHLCGYKDKTQTEVREMRDKEDFYLQNF